MYFVRMQFAHLHEALKVVDEVRKDQSLLALVHQCDDKTQDSFRRLEAFLPNGARRAEFEGLVGTIRHNVTLHYDETGKRIRRALTMLSARTKDYTSSITRGSTAYAWYFKAADSVVNNIVCHQIWGIPETADVMDEANKKVDRCHEIFLLFVDFAGEFIWKYCQE